MHRALAYYFCIYLAHEFMSEFIANVIDLAKKDLIISKNIKWLLWISKEGKV